MSKRYIMFDTVIVEIQCSAYPSQEDRAEVLKFCRDLKHKLDLFCDENIPPRLVAEGIVKITVSK